jgi:hypothetical protein
VLLKDTHEASGEVTIAPVTLRGEGRSSGSS